MHLFIQYTIFGLVLGGVYGIAASGLVLTYNTSGIFNFAHGAEAMLGAFVYWELRFGWHLPAPLALALVLAVFAPAMGLALHLVIMRGLRQTSEVTKIVVTVSITLGMLYFSQAVWNPSKPRDDSPFFGSSSTVRVLGSKITVHEVIALAVAVAIAVGLRLLFYRTRTGVAMRGVVDDAILLELNGHNPDRLAGLSWMLGAFLAVLAGVLVTPISGGALEATALTLLVIQSFAAAVFGRLRSFPRTFLGALVLGLGANYVLAYFPKTWSWTSDFRISLPMIVLFVVLVALPQDRLRGAAVERTRERFKVPTVRTAMTAAVVLVVVVVALRQLMVDSDVSALTTGMTFAVIALSLTLLTGYAGELNLAVMSFGAIATMISFHLGVSGHGLAARTTVWGIILGSIVAAVVGAVVALPALRLRGLYLALATMAFGVFVTTMVLADTVDHVLPVLHTHFSIFPQGSLLVPPPKLGPLDLRDQTSFLVSVTVLFAVLGTGLVALRNSSYGRRLSAMRDSPAASATLGQSLVRLKLTVFMASAAIAGLGGVLMSASLGSVTGDNFVIFASLALLMLTVVGGIGYVSGALFGGIAAGVGFSAIIATMNHLGTRSHSFHGLFAFGAHLAAIAPALIGVGLGKNPSGTISDIVESYRPLARARPVAIGGAAVEVALYVLALAGVLTNWWFVIGTVVVLLMLPVIGQMVMPAAFLPAAELERRRGEVAYELVGIDTPYAPALRTSLDRSLGLDAAPGDTVPIRRRAEPVGAGAAPMPEGVASGAARD